MPFAKKSLGQNFLNSQGALDDMIAAADVKAGDIVLEIGPGRGALTKEILKTGAQLVAIEKDRTLIPVLQEMFDGEIKKGQLTLIEGDILDLGAQLPELLKGPYKLIANIPYYITGQIFRMFLEGVDGHLLHQPISITMIVQKEVALRVVAEDKKESILSLSVKAYGTPKYVSTVKRGSFFPIPNVDSAVLHIGNISKTFFTENGISEKLFFEIVKAAFAHKRKTLGSNLKAYGVVSKDRAEDLTVEDFGLLIKSL